MAMEYTTTTTKRGQVTIPAQVRRLLGVKPKDKVTFTVTGMRVHIRPATFTLQSAYGSVEPSRKPEDFEEMSQIAKDEKAERTASKLKRR